MSSRWTSRKFITTLAAQIAALLVLLLPQHQDTIAQAAESIAALSVMLLSALGYIAAEASIDRESRTKARGQKAHFRSRRKLKPIL